MKMAKRDKQRQLSRLIEDENIHFHELEDVQPGNHSHIFDAIRDLGRYRFENYAPSSNYEGHSRPWRARLKAQVRRIVYLAEACRREQQKESGWRLKVEPEIFARFSTEATCKRCSRRLWRSEVEVLLNHSDGYGELLNLEQRQSMRKPCTCKDFQRYLDSEGPGVCRIFHDRADTAIKYLQSDPIASLLPTEQKPDRVFGYHETRRFANLLGQHPCRIELEGQQLRNALECGPFAEPRDPVLFPFLVLEAKCEDGDSFDSVDVQTAFPIKKLLDIQYRLKEAAGPESQWKSGPLVWFLSYRGDEWRVAVAYPQREQSTSKLHYHVFQLWNGSIRSKDGCLQLLLIVDYIWDWARDSHREAILGELQVLTGQDDSNFSDSDIASLGSSETNLIRIDMKRGFEDEAHERRYSKRKRSLESPERPSDSMVSVHAHLAAVYITEKTLGTLMSSLDSDQAVQGLAEILLTVLDDAWAVTSEALDAAKLAWTGESRADSPEGNSIPHESSGPHYAAMFNVTALPFAASHCGRGLALSYVAIAEDAIRPLQLFARRPGRVCLSMLPSLPPEVLASVIAGFRWGRFRTMLFGRMDGMKRMWLSVRIRPPQDSQPIAESQGYKKHEYGDCCSLARDPETGNVANPQKVHEVMVTYERNPKTIEIVQVARKCKGNTKGPEELLEEVSG